MRESQNNIPIESIEQVAQVLSGFDFKLDPEDFILYEVARMIEEDRATFEDEDFRRLIDEGIQQHIEESSHVRGELAARLRRASSQLTSGAQVVAERVARALENVDVDLRSAAVLVHSYTEYLFQKLEHSEDLSREEDTARDWIERWRKGEAPQETVVSELHRIGRPAVGPTADLVFEAPDDFRISDPAIRILAGIHSPASARVLAHTVAEPMLPEYLESKALDALRSMWPLARPYVLYCLHNHSHEDLPYRWFQLLVESNEASVVDLILEELRVHAANPAYREDLVAILDLLHDSRDPELQEKLLSVLNAEDTPAAVAQLLEGFFRKTDH
jgi:hypothetical protein